MVTDFVSWMIMGIRSPRASVRRFLDADSKGEVAILLVLLGFALTGAGLLLFLNVDTGDADQGSRIPGLFVSYILNVGMVGGMAHGLCRMAGGIATPAQTFIAVGWAFVINAAFLPILAIVSGGEFIAMEMAADGSPVPVISEQTLYAMGLIGALSVWLLASYLAEANGFTKTWKVAVSIVVAPTVFFYVVLMLSGAT